MAKISARGDTERMRWRHPRTGAELVLTTQGRLLSKPRGGTFTVAARLRDWPDRGSAEAQRQAAVREMVKV
jgi:hypothetical protein